jgi:nitroreductase
LPGVRVALVDGREEAEQVLSRYAGIYGLVQGAPHLLIGLLPEQTRQAQLDLGYALEQVVIEATRLGVASCWMTGSYEPDAAARLVTLQEGEEVAAAIAIGYPRQDRVAQLHDRLLRRVAGAARKKPLEEIVFDGQWGSAWSSDGKHADLVEILTCARLAPSAINRQPWRFIVKSEWLGLALVRDCPVDGGIVMAHVSLAAADLGWQGRWDLRLGDRRLGRSLSLPRSAIPVGVWRPEKGTLLSSESS